MYMGMCTVSYIIIIMHNTRGNYMYMYNIWTCYALCVFELVNILCASDTVKLKL